MPELLLEVGCEELPAVSVRRALSDLLALITSQLREADVLIGEGSSIGTPRRLIVSFLELKERQEDKTVEVRGPALKNAFTPEGAPTPALQGFCRGQGVSVDEVRKDDQYVWASKSVIGKPTAEIIAEAIPKAIKGMSFDKTMRWGDGRQRFVRPIRWILAAFGGEVVPFEVLGVKAGLESRGHRFYAPETFEATTLDELVTGLRARHVEPDPIERRTRIIEEALHVAGGVPDLTEGLVEENVYLTEWPVAIRGTFRDEYMNLPEPVLVTAMAKHERMFPVRDEDGKLTNRFVFIRNSGQDESVVHGCEWVLSARFNDAKFFFDEDAKHDLDYFLEKTEGILFQAKLGSVRKRADRLANLSEKIAIDTKAIGREIEFARTAGLYAKADLSTGLVSELSSLQGVIGGAYARRQGIFGSVAWAIETQYDISQNTDPGDCSGERASLRLAMADQLDKLAGYMGIGEEPSGSADPFGLRRATTILIDAAWMWPEALPSYDGFFDFALQEYKKQGIELNETAARSAFWRAFASRYESMLPEVRHDILEAALLSPESAAVAMPRAVRTRIAVLEALTKDLSFVQTATRPINIVRDARKKSIEFAESDVEAKLEHSALESAEGLELLAHLAGQQEALAKAEGEEDVDKIVELLQSLAAPINRFFESAMIMADQPEVRYARLTLVNAVARQLLTAGDFSKIVQA